MYGQLVQSDVGIQENHGQRKGSRTLKRSHVGGVGRVHIQKMCPFHVLECFNYGQKWHMAKMCKNGTHDAKQSRKRRTSQAVQNESDKEQELVEDSDDECEKFPVQKIGTSITRPYSEGVIIEDMKLRMESWGSGANSVK